MTDKKLDLIARLRERHTIVPGCPNDPLASLINPDGPEAADRLSSLEEEKRILRDLLGEICSEFAQQHPLIAKARAALSAGVGPLHTPMMENR